MKIEYQCSKGKNKEEIVELWNGKKLLNYGMERNWVRWQNETNGITD